MAASLVHWADHHPGLVPELLALLAPLPNAASQQSAAYATTLLWPADLRIAKRRIEWLMNRFYLNDLDDAYEAGLLLAEWRDRQTAAHPQWRFSGFTKQKPAQGLPCLIRREMPALSFSALAEGMTRASLGALTAATCATGDLRKADPDTQAWFFGNRQLDTYAIDSAKMDILINELQQFQIPHGIVMVNNRPEIIGISPTVSLALCRNTWGITELPL